MDKIKLGIVGYGNLGRGVECAAMRNEDMEVTAIYTRREPKELQILTADAQVLPITALDTAVKRCFSVRRSYCGRP